MTANAPVSLATRQSIILDLAKRPPMSIMAIASKHDVSKYYVHRMIREHSFTTVGRPR